MSFFPLRAAAVVLAFAACTPRTIPPAPTAPKASNGAAPRSSAEAQGPTDVVLSSDPPQTAVAEARLVPSSCEVHKGATEARIAQMRREVDAEFKRWHDGQPACWAEDRQRDAERKAMEACLRDGNCMFGLSGVGEGGGGYGEGIGLGSIGTIGHGAGMATSMSRTNNQVAGVDEADIVKTDGRFVYMVANGALRIVEALNPRVLSVTRLPGVVRELLVEGDRAVVFSASGVGQERCTYGYDCEVGGDGTTTRVDVFDITNRTSPKPIRKLELSGSLMASRRIGTTIHTVVADGDTAVGDYQTWPDGLPECGTPEAVVRAKFAALRANNEQRIKASTSLPRIVDRGVTSPLCAGLLDNRFDQVHTFTSLVSFDMRDPRSPISSATVRSRPGTVFASGNALYLSVQRKKRGNERWYSAAYPTLSEVSELHKFRIGGNPSDTRYAGSGVVPGHVLNQFAMDEWHGHLRVATTRGKVPNPDVESAVSIFAEGPGGDLVRVGAVEHLARGEDVRAVRFDDDRGYLVTFKKTDPLFVLDLHDVSKPKVLGELKIPGFSTYLHRIDPNHLLSIGFDANDHGDFAYFDGVLLQLFDVTKPTEPKLLHREKLGTRGSSSAAATNHLAFNYFAEKGLLAIPMTLCDGGGDGSNGHDLSFAGLVVYRVGIDRGFERLGGVAHAKEGSSCSTWWSKATSTVKRSVFLDDLVYSMAMDRVKVQRMGAFGKDVADLSLMP